MTDQTRRVGAATGIRPQPTPVSRPTLRSSDRNVSLIGDQPAVVRFVERDTCVPRDPTPVEAPLRR